MRHPVHVANLSCFGNEAGTSARSSRPHRKQKSSLPILPKTSHANAARQTIISSMPDTRSAPHTPGVAATTTATYAPAPQTASICALLLDAHVSAIILERAHTARISSAQATRVGVAVASAGAARVDGVALAAQGGGRHTLGAVDGSAAVGSERRNGRARGGVVCRC